MNTHTHNSHLKSFFTVRVRIYRSVLSLYEHTQLTSEQARIQLLAKGVVVIMSYRRRRILSVGRTTKDVCDKWCQHGKHTSNDPSPEFPPFYSPLPELPPLDPPPELPQLDPLPELPPLDPPPEFATRATI